MNVEKRHDICQIEDGVLEELEIDVELRSSSLAPSVTRECESRLFSSAVEDLEAEGWTLISKDLDGRFWAVFTRPIE